MRKSGGKTLKQAIQRRLLKEDIKRTVRLGLDAAAGDLVEVAIQLSSGTIDSAKEGAPYAVRHPNPAFDPALINAGFRNHPGLRFAQAWERLPQSQGPGIRNTSWVARFLEPGTKTMVRRPIEVLVLRRAPQLIERNLSLAFSASGNVTITSSSLVSTAILRPAAS